MSLGTWFRDYVYIPLGGNRVAPWRRIFNILVVWGLTGFWHGANWNFILWGLFYAVLLITEKQISLKRLAKIPSVFRHLVVCIITMIGFVLFASEDLSQVGRDIAGLFGGLNLPVITQETLYYLRSFAVVMIISILASTPVFSLLVKKVRTNTIGNTIVEVLTPVFMISLLLLCTAYLVDGSFNPFLYFRF
jgi:alginate O-acetyltransferase complex protein AlgI